MKIKKSMRYNLILVTLLIICCSFSSLLFYKTNDSQLSIWCNHLNDFYLNNDVEENRAPIIRIEDTKQKKFTDIFQNYYYCNSGTLISALRQFYNGESYLISTNKTQYKVCINEQDGYSIREKYEWGYYLDYGLFSTYYKDEYLPNRQYLERRYGANGFCFISDLLADKLVKEYDLQSFDDPYKELITNEKYSLLRLQIGSDEKDVTLCINNILFSKYRNAPRINELYGDFCLIYGDKITMNELNYSVEFDMKSDNYGTKTFLKSLNAMGYNPKSFNYQILKYNDLIDKYERVPGLEEELKKIDFEARDDTFISVGLIIIFIFLIFLITCTLLKCLDYMFYAICSFMFSIYFFITIFCYLPPAANIPEVIIVLGLIVSFIIKLKNKQTALHQKKGVYEVEI